MALLTTMQNYSQHFHGLIEVESIMKGAELCLARNTHALYISFWDVGPALSEQ